MTATRRSAPPLACLGPRHGLARADGTRLTAAAYDAIEAGPYSDGPPWRALFGDLNEDGALAIPARYLDAQPFADGVARVRTEAGWHPIDRTGAAISE